VKPSWFSPSAERSALPFADLELFSSLRVVPPVGEFTGIEHAWLGALCVSPDILIRKKGTVDFFFVAGHFADSVVLGFRAVPDPSFGKQDVFRLPSSGGPVFIAILSLDDWEGIPLTWLSPLSQCSRFASCRKSPHTSLRLVAARDSALAKGVLPLLKVCAHKAFSNCPVPLLRKLAKELDIEAVRATVRASETSHGHSGVVSVLGRLFCMCS
jgi:hypothetical protein